MSSYGPIFANGTSTFDAFIAVSLYILFVLAILLRLTGLLSSVFPLLDAAITYVATTGTVPVVSSSSSHRDISEPADSGLDPLPPLLRPSIAEAATTPPAPFRRSWFRPSDLSVPADSGLAPPPSPYLRPSIAEAAAAPTVPVIEKTLSGWDLFTKDSYHKRPSWRREYTDAERAAAIAWAFSQPNRHEKQRLRKQKDDAAVARIVERAKRPAKSVRFVETAPPPVIDPFDFGPLARFRAFLSEHHPSTWLFPADGLTSRCRCGQCAAAASNAAFENAQQQPVFVPVVEQSNLALLEQEFAHAATAPSVPALFSAPPAATAIPPPPSAPAFVPAPSIAQAATAPSAPFVFSAPPPAIAAPPSFAFAPAPTLSIAGAATAPPAPFVFSAPPPAIAAPPLSAFAPVPALSFAGAAIAPPAPFAFSSAPAATAPSPPAPAAAAPPVFSPLQTIPSRPPPAAPIAQAATTPPVPSVLAAPPPATTTTPAAPGGTTAIQKVKEYMDAIFAWQRTTEAALDSASQHASVQRPLWVSHCPDAVPRRAPRFSGMDCWLGW